MKILNRILNRNDSAAKDASRIYKVLMGQARLVEFYGPNKVPDNYDGRIDLLTLHIAVVLANLQPHGVQGQRLSQSVYDVMRDDFEVALREEGLSDAGIKRRIKPMMQLFFTRVKSYVEALDNTPELEGVIGAGLLSDVAKTLEAESKNHDFTQVLRQYTEAFHQELSKKSLGEIAMADFLCPKLYK